MTGTHQELDSGDLSVTAGTIAVELKALRGHLDLRLDELTRILAEQKRKTGFNSRRIRELEHEIMGLQHRIENLEKDLAEERARSDGFATKLGEINTERVESKARWGLIMMVGTGAGGVGMAAFELIKWLLEHAPK